MNQLLEKGIIKSVPKKWKKDEEQICLSLRESGFSASEIALKLCRTEVSVSIKLKRLTKTNDTYNKKHREDKYLYNRLFLDVVKPKSILDVYAANSFYDKAITTTNDIDTSFDCDTHMHAFDLLCKLNLEKKSFDLIDLDPYGSAIEEFSLALRIAKKGIVITLGEMGHKRWKRLDFVRKWYGVNSLEEFTTDNLVAVLQNMGLQHKKVLTVEFVREYNRISRVYFSIKPYKTLEQWL